MESYNQGSTWIYSSHTYYYNDIYVLQRCISR